MALMGFREPNEVAWVGVRPGHRGEQICLKTAATNATQIIYTVGAGSVLYLVWADITIIASAAGLGLLNVYDATPAIIFRLSSVFIYAAAAIHTGPFVGNPPLEIPSGYSIRIFSSIAGLTVDGSIFGWVE